MRRLRRRPAVILLPGGVTTFLEKYCAARGCRREEFIPHLFRRSLHRHALLLALVVAAVRHNHFAPDQELIGLAGRARTMRELDDERRDFRHDARNRHWWRTRARLRVSTRRLRRIAGLYLSAAPAEAR